MRPRVCVSQACGSTLFNLAVVRRLAIAAHVRPPPSEPADRCCIGPFRPQGPTVTWVELFNPAAMEAAVDHFVGIDVSLEQSSLCVMNGAGQIIAEGKAISEPEALVRWLRELEVKVECVGLEAGPLSQWLAA